VIEVIEEEQLCQRANVLGEELVAMLKAAQKYSSDIIDIRALGSMVAVEFGDHATEQPKPEVAKAIQQYAMDQGLLLLTCGKHGNVIRFLYPLTIPEIQFNQALVIIQDAIAAQQPALQQLAGAEV